MEPEELRHDDPRVPHVLDLIQRVFAEHDGRIDPPSSMHRLTLDVLKATARTGGLWTIGTPPVACMILTPEPDSLYVSKLAVDPAWRGKGLARRLIAQAETRARRCSLTAITLQTRVELTDNRATFAALGFAEVAQTAHPGFDRPTSIRMRKTV